MTLLVSFVSRFAMGLCAGLVLTPSGRVPAGFFRVNMLVVMGLCTLAALAAGGVASAWITGLLGAAGVGAWLASIAWGAGRSAGGMWLVMATGLATAITTASLAATGTDALTVHSIVSSLVALLSGLLVGLVVHAMLLGHWYLNAPGMSVEVLTAMIRWALLVSAAVACVATTAIGTLLAYSGDPVIATLAGLRWAAGIAGLPVLLVMALKTLEIPNTQSATGILYVACLAAIVGELASQLLQTQLQRPI